MNFSCLSRESTPSRLRRDGGGALIHVPTVEGRRTLSHQYDYGPSKHGIADFLESLRVELRREGAPVSVTAVPAPSGKLRVHGLRRATRRAPT